MPTETVDKEFAKTPNVAVLKLQSVSQNNGEAANYFLSVEKVFKGELKVNETGRLDWTRVKGKTENDLMKLPFKKVFAFRIGFLKPEKDFKNTVNLYNYLGWLYPIVRAVSSNFALTLAEVGKAMINSVTKGYEKQVLEVADIIELSKR
jgi:hypothetical protein